MRMGEQVHVQQHKFSPELLADVLCRGAVVLRQPGALNTECRRAQTLVPDWDGVCRTQRH
jgi:hypothetical protein